MSADLLGLVVAGLILAVVISWQFSRSREILRIWAKKNGYKILHSEYRFFFRGPFLWNSSNAQTVYYVKVKDKDLRTRSGWVRCGGTWWGLLSDNAEVRWE